MHGSMRLGWLQRRHVSLLHHLPFFAFAAAAAIAAAADAAAAIAAAAIAAAAIAAPLVPTVVPALRDEECRGGSRVKHCGRVPRGRR